MEILNALAKQGIETAQEVLESFARVEDAAFEAFRVLTEERLLDRLAKGTVATLEGLAEARANAGIPNGDGEPLDG